MNCFVLYLELVRCLDVRGSRGRPTHAVSRSHDFNVLALVSAPRFQGPFFRRKRVQRYNHFPNWQKYFSLFQESFLLCAVGQRIAEGTFFRMGRISGCKTGFHGAFFAIFGGALDGYFRGILVSRWYSWMLRYFVL